MTLVPAKPTDHAMTRPAPDGKQFPMVKRQPEICVR
jgi:hypothetical protein